MSCNQINSICVYCGSSAGFSKVYTEQARELGRLLAANKIRLVYGAGNIGLMGVIADSVLQNGGSVIGVIPESLADKELAHQGLTELHVVPSMHIRKAKMAAEADAFIAMPGGLGTFEELCEIATWVQLGFESKPIGVLNTRGYFDPLLAQLDRAVDEGFLKTQQRQLLLESDQPAELLDRLQNHQVPDVEKWIVQP